VTHQFCVLRRQGCVCANSEETETARHYRTPFPRTAPPKLPLLPAGRRNRQACETAKAHGFADASGIAFRKGKPAPPSAMMDGYGQFSAWIINGRRVRVVTQTIGYGRVVQLRAELVESGRHLPANRCQAITSQKTIAGV